MSAKRVLVVDDDSAIREILSLALSRSGYDVTTAASAEDALGRLLSVDPGIVITDVRMSGMDGLELLRVLRERVPDLHVVVITAFEDMRTAIAAMRAGAFDYLVKPLDLDQIELVIERCFRDRAQRRRLDHLEQEASAPYALNEIVGRNATMIAIYKMIGAVSATRTPVLVRGETGTGKELIARAIHFSSDDAQEPFVALNCTAIPENLLEAELFGHVKGAFTGATNDRRGRFALAGRGTIFLDEIGDTSLAFQAKLLRVLQQREFYPVGAEQPLRTEARVIAATHRDLPALVASGKFREDLYFRLRVVEIAVPPIRERRGDLPLLVDHIMSRLGRELHEGPRVVSPAAMKRIAAYDWPGNVRELENALTRAVVLSRGRAVLPDDLSLEGAPRANGVEEPSDDTLRAAERAHVIRVLTKANGNKRLAARLLGVSRSRLDRLFERHGLGSAVPAARMANGNGPDT
jgi:DNA-binding NtrC family response regulator